MKKKIKLACLILLILAASALTVRFFLTSEIVMFDTKGLIALKERNLLIISTLLMLIVVIPVFILTFVVAWKYRSSNTKAKYTPEWDLNILAEAIWWGVPFLIIIVLSVITWISSHELDPYRPLDSEKKPVTIQVVALQWKWLFIYPEQNIATVNYFQFPEQTPVNFEISAEAPMNSFWIPQLGGQIFAMPGMRTKLHLIADEVGEYRGSSANLSGKGFSGMTFMAKALSEKDFSSWVESMQESPNALTLDAYNKLAKPSENHGNESYVLKVDGLFDHIVMKYMMYTPGMKGVDVERLENEPSHK
ncbi:MAG: ubiquinol oxidase subunit II [Chlamydiae bacterium]|nr:ubiquinol oxidase subunit II [Chlamydiota bacterium]